MVWACSDFTQSKNSDFTHKLGTTMTEELNLEEFTTEGVEGDPLRTVLTAIVDEMEEMGLAIAELQTQNEQLNQAVANMAAQMVLLDGKLNASA
jgi:hypothetical protein